MSDDFVLAMCKENLDNPNLHLVREDLLVKDVKQCAQAVITPSFLLKGVILPNTAHRGTVQVFIPLTATNKFYKFYGMVHIYEHNDLTFFCG